MSEYKYKFSIVTAVYNVELFVAETIESIIAQDIGFENVQLILVDDGSPDNSGAICDEYAAKYPDNIVVIHKENGGVSSARNMGLERVEGKYVNFIDSDDLFPEDTLSKVWDFFEKHYDETDLASIPLIFFDGYKGVHPLNYKFVGDARVVDLKEEWSYVQLSLSSSFVKKEYFEKLRFDTRLSFAEDAQLVQKILLEKQTIGIIPDAKYMYRRRTVGAPSAIQNSTLNPKWYLPNMRYFQKEILNYALEKCGEVPKFIQYTLMYDLQWRIKRPDIPADILTEEEKAEYEESIKHIIQYIEDDVIMAQIRIFREHKLFALKLKYGSEPKCLVTENDITYSFSEDTKFAISKCRAHIEFLNIENNVLKLEGYVAMYDVPFNEAKINILLNGKTYECKQVKRNNSIFALEREVLKRMGFYCEIPLDINENYEIKVVVTIDKKDVVLSRLSYDPFSPVNKIFKYSYCIRESWTIFTNKEKNTILVYKATLKRKLGKELKFLAELFIKNVAQSRKAACLRVIYHICKVFKKKPLWLVSDRQTRAGDNGEAFFRYVCENYPEIDCRFVISKNCADYERMKAIGTVVHPFSIKHKLSVLLSDYILSSQGEKEVYDPFKCHFAFDNIIVQKPFIFLQHGVTKDDISSWLNRYKKNISGFVVVGQNEYDSILEYDYSYTPERVWLTGFPRFDRLNDASKKIISILPTWRKYLTTGRDIINDYWNLIPDFENSDFFTFYNSLINDERVINTAKKYGYKLNFLLHPNLITSATMFAVNDITTIITENVDYNKLYAESNLIITDYSSAVFDFAYMRKPIFYTHFDKEEFFAGGHSYQQGYFDYERDGFGEVEYDLESTVNRIIEYMENDCQLKDAYRERIDNFFAYNDKNNCQRIYEKLIEGRK